jgi:class 3 adenylate cyclase
VARDRDGLELRIGIDAGEPVREGDDFFGTPVIVARRLCDAARRGQIMVSERARELVDERGEHEFESLGALTLKGLREPVSACALRWAPSSEPRAAAGRVRRRTSTRFPFSGAARA